MPDVTLVHFKRAAADIGAHGDNDTLPFDIDNRFIKDRQDELAAIAYEYFSRLEKNEKKHHYILQHFKGYVINSSKAIFLGKPHWCNLSSGPVTMTERPEKSTRLPKRF